MAKKRPPIHRMLIGLDKISEGVDALSLADLESLEGELEVVTEEVSEALTRKRIPTAFEGYALDPILPANFSCCANDDRPASHKFWWYRPYIVTKPAGDKKCYWVECLDGGAWDRPTWWGNADTLEAAVEICKTGPSWTGPTNTAKPTQ